jgi:hypothetical protein
MLYDIESTSCRHCEPLFLFTSFTSSTSRCCTISNQHRIYIVNLSCLHRRHRNVVRYRINIVSTLWTFLLVYIVHIVDIECCTISNQHRIDIVNLSSCLHRSHRRHRVVVQYRINLVSTLWTFLLVYIVDIAMLHDIESTSCLHCEPFFLFRSSTLRCCTISNQHRIDTVNLSSCLHRSHRRHRDVVRYRNNIVSTLWSCVVYIVDIAMWYDIKSTLRRHCVYLYTFILTLSK